MKGTAMLAMLLTAVALADKSPYRATEAGNNLEVTTPQGSRLLIGDLGFDALPSYRVEIPLKDLAPSGSGESAGSGGGGKSANAPNPEAMDDDRLVLEANRLYNQGKFNEALAMVEALLQRNPQHVRGWMMRGSLMHVMGQRDLARKAWAKALQLDPANHQVRTLLEKYR